MISGNSPVDPQAELAVDLLRSHAGCPDAGNAELGSGLTKDTASRASTGPDLTILSVIELTLSVMPMREVWPWRKWGTPGFDYRNHCPLA